MPTNLTASTFTALVADLEEVSAGGGLAAANTDYVITITANYSETADLPAVSLLGGSTLTIVGDFAGGPSTLSGGTVGSDQYLSGLRVLAGSVTVRDLEMTDMLVQGTPGASGSGAGSGGGAGLGGRCSWPAAPASLSTT
jgi:hypothetical protein